LFTVGERRTIRVFIMAVKPLRPSEDRGQAFAHHVDRLAEFETPETKALLAEGREEFWRRASNRILRLSSIGARVAHAGPSSR